MSYILREQLANPGNFGGSRTAEQIKYLVIHYTANDGDFAANNAAYFQNTVVKASAHYFVDDTAVYRSVPDLRVAWAVGGSKWNDCAQTGGGTMYGKITNANSLSIELCDTRRDGTYQATEATMANAAELAKELMERYGIPIENVYRHFDVNGKHCPAYMMDRAAWAAFKARLTGIPAGAQHSGGSGGESWSGGMRELPSETEHTAAMDNTPAPAHKAGVDWAVEQGILTGNAQGDLMLSAPLTRQQFCTMLCRYDQMKRK